MAAGDGVQAVLELPFARPVAAAHSGGFKSGETSLPVSRELLSSIQATAKETGASVEAVLLAAFHTVIARYTGSFDVGFTTVSATGKKLVGANPQVGEDATLDQSVQACEAALKSGGAVAKSVELVFHYASQPEPVMKTITSILDKCPSGFKWMLGFHPNADGATAKLVLAYHSPEFAEEDMLPVGRHVLQVLSLLGDSLGRSSTKVKAADILPPAERHTLLTKWNSTDVEIPDMTLSRMLEKQAAQYPHKVAAATFFSTDANGQPKADREVTYAQLNDAANQLAHHLRATAGVGRGSYVGIYMDRGVDLLIGLFAILKSGAAYVPLDPVYPLERLGMMLEDSSPPCVLTQGNLAKAIATVSPTGATIVSIDGDAAAIAACPRGNLSDERSATPEDVAYAIFTSGSTGRPKGVPIQHKSVINLLISEKKLSDMLPTDTLLAITTICFDIAGLEMFMPILAGGRVVIASRDQAHDADVLMSLLVAADVHVLQATPSTWRMLVRSGWRGKKSMRALIGGEALPVELAQDLVPLVSSLLNVYGPTETTIWSTTAVVDLKRPTSIGHPLDNTTVYVLDAHLNPLPAGIPGELHIGGVGLSPGYLGLPTMTAERFIPSPFVAGERIYKTGDLARFCRDGTLECLGRLDFQVKIRGYRIELGEIEAVLGGHDLCDAAVCDAKDLAGEGDKQLIAYVVPAAKAEENGGAALENGAHENGAVAENGDGVAAHNSAADLAEIASWGAIYDEAYASANAVNADPTLNFSGYDNSYTPRIPHKSEVVREWVETTCDRIAELKPSRCVEMGCGNGMIMLRCAAKKYSELYIGTDLSEEAIRYCEDMLAHNPRFQMPHVSVALAGAHESNRYADKNLDCVVCNGVSMYFPSADYLLAVCQSALDALQPGGSFFLGDVRNGLQLEHFHASVRLFQAKDDMPVRELRRVVRRAIAYEKELLVDPALFTCAVAGRLPWLGHMEMQIKRGFHKSEFAMYRYDVTFRKCPAGADGRPARPAPGEKVSLAEWIPGQHSLAGVKEQLKQLAASGGSPEVLGFRGLLDARLAFEGALVERLASMYTDPSGVPETCGVLRNTITAEVAATHPVEPEEAYRLAEACGYRAQCFWTPGRPCHFDWLLVRKDVPIGKHEPLWLASRRAAMVLDAEALSPLARYTSKWGQEALQEDVNAADSSANSDRGSASLSAKDIAALQEALRVRVPEYMVPKVFVAMDRLPMTANGKVDRKALPPPAPSDLTAARRMDEYEPPSGATEEALAECWRDLLKVPEVGAKDDFFEIGGHSLMAMQLVQQIKARFGVKLSLFRLTEASQLRELAALVDSEIAALSRSGSSGALAAQDDDDEGAVRVVKERDLPMTFEVESVDIPMKDGVRLSARLWRPVVRQGGATPKAPAVLEVLPYRKSDGTVEIDSMTFPYLAGHGLACLRVDARGCGDSEGILDDEYSERGQADAVECIEWAASQEWCTGAVGIMGCSWGGFTALQAAARQPPALKAVVAVCCTDDRFADDMHYMGGSLLTDNLSWGSWMMHTVTQPPDPDVVGSEEWKAMWEERLEQSAPPFRRWLEHGKADDSYWATGSVNHQYGRIWAPVFAIGGWNAGGYANSVPRLAAGLKHTPCKALLGPWSHNYPHTSPLGPGYGFLHQVVRWFRHHLLGEATGIMDEPLFQVYAAQPHAGAPPAQASAIPGRWLSAPGQGGLATADSTLALGAGGVLAAGAAGAEGPAVELPLPVKGGHADPAGQCGGAWFTFGVGADLPTDQSPDDARSACFDTAPLPAERVLCGRPVARLALRGAGGALQGSVAARLCAVSPEGVSHRITYGVLNLARGASGGGAGGVVEVEMDYTAFTVPAGFRMRLAVSAGYWPILWPSADAPVLSVATCASTLVLPEVAAGHVDAAATQASAIPVPPLEVFEPAQTSRVRRGASSRTSERLPGGGVQVKLVEDRGARRFDGPQYKGLVLDTTQSQTYTVAGDGSCSHVVEFATQQQRVGGGWDAQTKLRSEMTADGGEIRIATCVEARSGGTTLFKREWTDFVQRNGL